ncbi:Zinc finger CCCH domain-containing protein 6, partial [Cucurbita argyrosperma subsp. sororia]
MRGLHKGKRVSWASDLNLRQVRLFLSEDCPSQVGLGAQDHLQAKASWLLHSTGSGSDDTLPPGFEVAHSENQSQIKLSQIPVNQWRCPPKFVLNLTWQVVVGEESREVVVENQREMRVLEAVYPRPSAIPPNPSVVADSERANVDDSRTPLIPITPVEDEDATTKTSSDYASPASVLNMSAQPSPFTPAGRSTSQHVLLNAMSSTSSVSSMAGMDLGNKHDVVAAASAALGALVKSNEIGNSIDRELLVNILNNPKMIEQLVVDSGVVTSTQKPISSPDPQLVHMPMSETNATITPPFFSQPNGGSVAPVPNAHPSSRGVPVSSSLPSNGAPMKDLNYYKSLIQQHGGERQDDPPRQQQFPNRHNQHLGTNQEFLQNQPSREAKFKIMKPCIYFNSPRGCRHGANCAYQHDPVFQQRSSSVPEMPTSAKRTKVDREISS